MENTSDNNASKAVDFDTLKLGAKIVGPLGPEVKASFLGADAFVGKAVSYVACPEGMSECNPKTAPEGTIFTFVHQISPGTDEELEGKIANSASEFFMNKPSYGYNGVSGYSFAQANDVLGSETQIAISCVDGALKWSVDGDWKRGQTLTFFWQSTLPPKGPDTAYSILSDEGESTGAGPYPGLELKDAPTCA